MVQEENVDEISKHGVKLLLSQEAYGILLLLSTVIELIIVCRRVVSEQSLWK